jgi:hypothetical protein
MSYYAVFVYGDVMKRVAEGVFILTGVTPKVSIQREINHNDNAALVYSFDSSATHRMNFSIIELNKMTAPVDYLLFTIAEKWEVLNG